MWPLILQITARGTHFIIPVYRKGDGGLEVQLLPHTLAAEMRCEPLDFAGPHSSHTLSLSPHTGEEGRSGINLWFYSWGN
jgi:hypothetical protein